jgi:hypothetical protein
MGKVCLNKFIILFCILLGFNSCNKNTKEMTLLAPYGSNYPLEIGMPVYSDSLIIGRISNLDLKNKGDIVVNIKLTSQLPENVGFCYASSILTSYIRVTPTGGKDTLRDCNENKSKLSESEQFKKLSEWIEAIDSTL